MQQKQPCPLTPTQIILFIFPSNTKQQLNFLKSYHKLKKEVRSKAGLKVEILRSSIKPPKAALLQTGHSQGNQGAETDEMFRENSPRKLRIQGLWADRGGLVPPEVLQRLDLSLSHHSTRTDKRKLFYPHTQRGKPSLHQTKPFASAALSFTLLPITNPINLNLGSPNPENISRQLPWELPGWKALIHGWRN